MRGVRHTLMEHEPQLVVAGAAAACLCKASSFLATCSRPNIKLGIQSTTPELSAALTDLVSAAVLFGCKRSFWRWAADAAHLLGRSEEGESFRQRFENGGGV